MKPVTGSRTLVMGIVNCTPDSFYAGSRSSSAPEAVAQGLQMVAEGADLLDVGGESTRPGSDPVPEDEERRRVVPVIQELSRQVTIPISVDTYRAGTARDAIEAGATMVNDVSALRSDPAMSALVRDTGVSVVLMHMRGRPKDMQSETHYGDLMGDLLAFFRERISAATGDGIPHDRLVVDPGIGFAKTAKQSFELLRRLGELRSLGCPILVGPSRKSFIGGVLGLPPEERLEGTAAAVAIAIANGADIVRVHDVKAMVRVARVADATKERGEP